MDTTTEQKSTTLIPFEGVFNCRDVGKTINTFLGRKALREGIFYRSGRLDEATSPDIDTLKNHLRISAVVDLRTNTEHERRNMPSSPRAPPDPGILSSQDGSTAAAGTRSASAYSAQPRHDIKTYEVLFPRTGASFYYKAVFPQLSWLQFFLVLVLYIFRMKALMTKIVIRHAIQPLGLRGLAEKWLEFCGGEIKEVMDIFAPPLFSETLNTKKADTDAQSETAINYPILIHCTQGKDRTGIITLLILILLLGTTLEVQEAIEYDYMMSNIGLAPMKERTTKEMKEVGFNIGGPFAKSPKDYVGHVIQYLENKWGTVDNYLESIGVSRDQMESIKRNLLVTEDDTVTI